MQGDDREGRVVGAATVEARAAKVAHCLTVPAELAAPRASAVDGGEARNRRDRL